MRKSMFALAGSVMLSLLVNGQGATGAIAPSLSSNSNSLVARGPDVRGWSDPALNHNRLLGNRQGDGVFTVVGQYKVKGSCFLFGQGHTGDVFSKDEKGYNITISYNTYNQELEFISASNPGQPLVKEPGDLDSFSIKQDITGGIMEDLKFVYGKLLGSSEKTYFQVVASGGRFSLYKRYKSELGFVGDNIGNAELRQFDLTVDYFYYDTETKKLKKLKANPSSVTKEFQKITDVSSAMPLGSFDNNPEAAMRNAFQLLNQQTEKKAF